MASPIEITSAEGTFDLYNDVEDVFYITAQIHDLNDLNTRNASYSRTIPIPPTPNNLKLLNILGSGFTQPTQTIPVVLKLSGITVDPDASLLVTRIERRISEIGIEVTVLFGNFDFFDKIADGKINELNWADLAIEWQVDDLITASTNQDDLVYPIADWYDRSSIKVLDSTSFNFWVDVNPTGFFIYAKEIMKRLADKAEFDIEFQDLPDEFYNLALACPVTKFVDSPSTETIATNLIVQNNANQVVVGGSTRMIFQVKVLDPQGRWNLTTNQWENVPTGEYVLYIQGRYSYDKGSTSNPNSRFDIYRNTALIASYSFANTDQGDDIPFFFDTDIAVVSGDIIYAEIVATNGPGGNDDTLTLLSGSQFRLISPGNDLDRTVQPSQFIPEMDNGTFFKSILGLYNLVIVTSPIERKIIIRQFNEVFVNEPFDVTDFLTTSEPFSIKPSIGSIGRNTKFEWEEDNLLRRDANYSIDFKNAVLKTEAVALGLPFSACDNSIQLFRTNDNNFLKAKLPSTSKEDDWYGQYNVRILNNANGQFVVETEVDGDLQEVDFQVGSFFVIKTAPSGVSYYCRVVSKANDSAGTFQTPLPFTTFTNLILVKISNMSSNEFTARLAVMVRGEGSGFTLTQGTTAVGTTGTTTSSAMGAIWLDSLKMSEVATNQYGQLMEAFVTPQVVNAWIKIDIANLVNIDFLRPVFLSNLGGYYYINKIEQFKVDNLCRVELVRLSSFQT